MNDPFYLGAYWGPREQPVDECAQRLAGLFNGLGECDPLLARWFSKPRSRKHSPVRVDDAEIDALRDLLIAGVNRDDFDRSPIEDLGFSLAVWNGDGETPVGLSVTCGARTSAPGIMNSVVLDLPPPSGEPATRLYELDVSICLVGAVVTGWDPDWATFTSYGLADAIDTAPRVPSVGWITYLSDRRPSPTHVPATHHQRLGQGTIFVGADRVSAMDLSKAQNLAAALKAAGALAATP